MKITDSLLAYQNVETEVIPDESDEKKLPLSEMERHGLCYIGGYVMHKLYKKIKNSTKWRSVAVTGIPNSWEKGWHN